MGGVDWIGLDGTSRGGAYVRRVLVGTGYDESSQKGWNGQTDRMNFMVYSVVCGSTYQMHRASVDVLQCCTVCRLRGGLHKEHSPMSWFSRILLMSTKTRQNFCNICLTRIFTGEGWRMRVGECSLAGKANYRLCN